MTTGVSHPAGDIPGDFSQALDEVKGRSVTSIQEATGGHSPYPRSWVDRLTDWVDRQPVPAWAFYLALGVVLSLGYMLLLLASPLWASGAVDLGGVLFYSFLNGLTFPYLTGLVHYLDNSAAAALSRFRPVMTVDDAGYHKLLYQLTTLPARTTLFASGLGAAYTFAVLAVNILSLGSLGSEVMAPLLVVQVVGYNVPIYVLVAVLIYHTIHQLRMVNTIYTHHTRINLFQLGPLYALSGLTARTAIGIAIPTYVWFQANSLSATGTTVSDIIQTVFLGSMVVVTFVWPLLGAHGLLEREKQRLQDEVARRIEATIATVHGRVDNSELGDLGMQKEALNVLMTEQSLIAKLRTWPWRTETVSGLGLTFLLPVLIWAVQRVLERLGF
ncbi:MAG TPA: hypothetical protein VF952_05750 [Chloroflexia bacterium]